MVDVQTTFEGPPNDDGVLASWEFPEFEKPERGVRWYVIAAVISGSLLVYSIISRNYIFGVIIILIALIYFLYDLHEPPQTVCSITTAGIQLGKKFVRYSNIAHFWIIYKPGITTTLYVKPKIFTVPELGIPLQKEDPLQIREILLQYLPENLKEEDEPLSETLGRVLKL